MISYELAKKLAQHGFPQETKEHYITDEDGGMVRVCHMESPIHRKMDVMYDYTAKPSLFELIEACHPKNGIIFTASCNGNTRWGNTPEEAVAFLWLELNKKEV